MHDQPHPSAGQTVTIRLVNTDDKMSFELEDWVDRVCGEPWHELNGNPAAIRFAMRWGCAMKNADDEVVYGKISSGFGIMVHASEILEE